MVVDKMELSLVLMSECLNYLPKYFIRMADEWKRNMVAGLRKCPDRETAKICVDFARNEIDFLKDEAVKGKSKKYF